ncbi:hypothetical protein JQS43_13095 [Natronosporangium hydrolyticum]|uniref:Uncharacterized protein n=1 Tax=Natronosporangium hydrolyticum TaxID=2811111 RepID=A0A895Y8Q1_9ACTN|nr:hypothetical protein [Natronosporangium hydrolyticum]QSB12642.1 hypothetical protein JQS43_13095 [Natronosporangium hydrolyticum]
MTSAKTADGGLSTADIEEIRAAVAAGRKPKVVFTEQAGQIAGQVGQVVGLTDPAESDEWVVVRFGRDELPFSPGDLAPAPKGGGRAAKQTTASAPASPPAPAPVPAQPAAASAPVNGGSPAAGAGASEPAAAPAEAAAKPAKKATKAGRAAKPKPPPAMAVTVAYEAGEWTVAAYQGNKTLAKPYVIRPTEALKMVALLDVPGVHEAVEQIVNAERAEAQQRADTLRNELAEVEARLAELRDAG